MRMAWIAAYRSSTHWARAWCDVDQHAIGLVGRCVGGGGGASWILPSTQRGIALLPALRDGFELARPRLGCVADHPSSQLPSPSSSSGTSVSRWVSPRGGGGQLRGASSDAPSTSTTPSRPRWRDRRPIDMRAMPSSRSRSAARRNEDERSAEGLGALRLRIRRLQMEADALRMEEEAWQRDDSAWRGDVRGRAAGTDSGESDAALEQRLDDLTARKVAIEARREANHRAMREAGMLPDVIKEELEATEEREHKMRARRAVILPSGASDVVPLGTFVRGALDPSLDTKTRGGEEAERALAVLDAFPNPGGLAAALPEGLPRGLRAECALSRVVGADDPVHRSLAGASVVPSPFPMGEGGGNRRHGRDTDGALDASHVRSFDLDGAADPSFDPKGPSAATVLLRPDLEHLLVTILKALGSTLPPPQDGGEMGEEEQDKGSEEEADAWTAMPTGKLVLHGPRGSGKSVAMAALVATARHAFAEDASPSSLAGGVVVYLPSARAVTCPDGRAGRYAQHPGDGLWDTPDVALSLLASLRTAHGAEIAAIGLSHLFRCLDLDEDALDDLLLGGGGRTKGGKEGKGEDDGEGGGESGVVEPTQAFCDLVEGLCAQTAVPVLLAIDDYDALFARTGMADPTSAKAPGMPMRKVRPNALRLQCALRLLERHRPRRGVVVAATSHDVGLRRTQQVPLGDASVFGMSPLSPQEAVQLWTRYKGGHALTIGELDECHHVAAAAQGDGHEIRDASAFLGFGPGFFARLM